LKSSESGFVGKVCVRRRAAGGFKNFALLLRLLINVKELLNLREKGWQLPRFN
jgi:hypothetical protein